MSFLFLDLYALLINLTADKKKGPFKTALMDASNHINILASLLASEFDLFVDSNAGVKERTGHQYQRATGRTH